MANLTIKNLATTHGGGQKTPVDADALLLEQADATPAWCALSQLPFPKKVGAITAIEVVASLPDTPNATTLYIVTG